MDLDQLLAFHKLVMNKPEKEKIHSAQTIGIDYGEYKQRIIGKEKETDFIAIMKSLGVLKHLEAYDEEFSHITKEYTPDFKIELVDGYKFLLEIKSTDKDAYKISKGNLQKRIDFANRQELPLRFAVSLKGIWGLFTSETMQSKSKLRFEDFIGEKSTSYLDLELGTCVYMFPEQIKIRSIYSKTHPKGMGIQFKPYGQLVSYELYCGNKKIFRAKGEKSYYMQHNICLEALQDRISNANHQIKQDGEFTIITDYSDPNVPHYIPEYEFLLSPINHLYKIVNGEEILYDSQSALSKHDFSFLPVQELRFLLSELVDLGLEIIVFRRNTGYRFKDFVANYWYKKSDLYNN